MRKEIIILGMLFFAFKVNAQEVNDEHIDVIKNEEREEQNQTLKDAVQALEQTTTVVNQKGQQNEAYIMQNPYSMNGINYLEVNQYGYDHRVEMNMKGKKNSVRIEQTNIELIPDMVEGSIKGHTYTGDIYGNENLINIKQTGSGNTTNQTAIVDYLNMDVHQSGYNNELNLINNTLSAPPVQVKQSGHDMKITIENNVMPIPRTEK